MYFSDVLGVLRRRWYVLVAGALLMGLAGIVSLKGVETQYQASGQLLLLAPQDADAATEPVNPFVNQPSGLVTAATLIASTVTDHDTRATLTAQGMSTSYSVVVNPGTGALLVVAVVDTDAPRAVRTRDAILTRLQSELLRVQKAQQVPASQYITAQTNSVPSQADALPGSKIRALAGIAAGGGVLTLIVTFSLDRLRRPRPQPPVASAPRDLVDVG